MRVPTQIGFFLLLSSSTTLTTWVANGCRRIGGLLSKNTTMWMVRMYYSPCWRCPAHGLCVEPVGGPTTLMCSTHWDFRPHLTFDLWRLESKRKNTSFTLHTTHLHNNVGTCERRDDGNRQTVIVEIIMIRYCEFISSTFMVDVEPTSNGLAGAVCGFSISGPKRTTAYNITVKRRWRMSDVSTIQSEWNSRSGQRCWLAAKFMFMRSEVIKQGSTSEQECAHYVWPDSLSLLLCRDGNSCCTMNGSCARMAEWYCIFGNKSGII